MDILQRLALLKNIGFSKLKFVRCGVDIFIYTYKGLDKGYKLSELVNMSDKEFDKLTYRYIN